MVDTHGDAHTGECCGGAMCIVATAQAKTIDAHDAHAHSNTHTQINGALNAIIFPLKIQTYIFRNMQTQTMSAALHRHDYPIIHSRNMRKRLRDDDDVGCGCGCGGSGCGGNSSGGGDGGPQRTDSQSTT